MAMSEPSLSVGSVQPGEAQDRTASGLQYQRYNQGLEATGAALGKGLRVAPDPNVLFSHPLSGAQFGGNQDARATTGAFEESTEDD